MMTYTAFMMIRDLRLGAARSLRWLPCLALASLSLTQAACDDKGDGFDGGQAMEDGGSHPGPDADTGPADRDADATAPEPKPDTGPEAGPEAGPEEDGGQECESNADCDDQLVCNGDETCVEGACVPGTPKACSKEHPCSEAIGGCDCADPDYDDDGSPSIICVAGPTSDCDDGNREIGRHAVEICDDDGVDEDCDAATFNGPNDGDNDDDGFISDQCRNWDPDKNDFNRGNDCRDNNPSIHPRASEVCDYEDNNCNRVIDEKLDSEGNPVSEEGGLRGNYWPDRDGDGCGDKNVAPTPFCDFARPVGYVGGQDPCDCNDDPQDNGANIYDDAPEVCDGDDNDCDGEADEEDDLVHEYDFTLTKLECIEGAWEIAMCPPATEWCDTSTVEHGCETDATTLSNCRDCGVTCNLACGTNGCDEVKQLALGTYHSCALTEEGNVACWGRGGEGRLGHDSTQPSAVPERAVIANASHIGSGFDHTCAAVGANAEVYCWGSNVTRTLPRTRTGQLGNPDAADASAVPLPVVAPIVGTIANATQVAAGLEHSCAVLESGYVYCWGERRAGRLGGGYEDEGPGDAETVTREVYYPDFDVWLPTEIENGSQVALGAKHSCLRLDTGAVECWGDNSKGQLGSDAQLEIAYSAVVVDGIEGVTMVAAGAFHTCAVAGGGVYCWGDNDQSQLGRTTTGNNHVPQRVEGLSDVVSIALGNQFSCALDGSGKVSCWGTNDRGVFGVSSSQLPESATPVVLPLNDVIEVSAARHLCAQTLDKQVRCLGSDDFGQLGDGRASNDPVLVPSALEALRGSKP